MINAGVVYKSRFIQQGNDINQVFSEYINYIDRDDAIRNKNFNKFSLYNDYMSNPEKSSGLFNETIDQLTNKEKEKIKEVFKIAQKRGSLLWQDVISFDNKWLEKHGLYQSETNYLDEEKLKNVTRAAVAEMFKKEKGKVSMVWTAAIHYNTDNIHIHIAYCEPIPTRTRGKKKPSTLDLVKSTVVNQILEREEEFKKINDLVRNKIVNQKKQISFSSTRHMKKLFFQVYHALPDDRRQWNYNNNSIHHLRPMIDEMSRKYIEKYHAGDYATLIKKLDKETQIMKEAYGEGDKEKHRYENYKTNKINDLYTRLGNAILKEMREYAKEQSQLSSPIKLRKRKMIIINNSNDYMFRKLRYYMNREFESWKNQRYYEWLENELER